MTCIAGWIRTVTIAAGLVLSATGASAQSASPGQATMPACAHCRLAQTLPGAQSMATMNKDMMARMATEDARLEALVADMNMFTGEMKLEAMARVLTLLVERQSMMRKHMMDMHGRMMPEMGAISARPPAVRRTPMSGRQRTGGDVLASELRGAGESVITPTLTSRRLTPIRTPATARGRFGTLREALKRWNRLRVYAARALSRRSIG